MVARLFKRLLRLAAWAVLFLTFGYSITYKVLNDEALGRLISGKVNKLERGNFQLRYVHYPFWSGLASILFNTPVHVEADDFTLHDPDGNLVLKVPHVEADARLQTLVISLAKFGATQKFHLNLHVEHAHVPDAMAVVAPLRSSLEKPKQEMNVLSAMSPKVITPPVPGGDFRVQVDDLTIDHVFFGLGFFNQAGQVAWSGKILDAQAQARLLYQANAELESPVGPYLFFKVMPLKSNQGELNLGAFHFPLEAIEAIEFGPNGDRREDLIFKAKAKSLGADARVEGVLAGAYGGAPSVKMKLDFERGQKLAALLPDPLGGWLGGEPRGTLYFAGPLTHIVIDGTVENAVAKLAELHLTQLESKLHLDAGLLTLDPKARMAGGRASGRVVVELDAPAWWRAHVNLRGVNPAEVPLLPKNLQAQLAGKLDMRAKLGSSLDHPEPVAIEIEESSLEREHAGQLPRVLKIAGKIDYAPAKLLLKDLALDGDGVKVGANGTVNPKSQAIAGKLSVDSARGAAYLQRLGLPAGVKVGEAHLAGSIGGTLSRPEIDAKLRAADVSVHDRNLETAQADLELRGGTVKVSELHGAGLGGSVDGEAAIELYDEHGDLGHLLREPHLVAHLSARGADVGALAGWRDLDGRAEASFDVDGPLADPRGRAELRVPKLSVRGDPYVDGHLQVDLGHGHATIRALNLTRKAGGRVTGAGDVDWKNGRVDLRVAPTDFPIPAIPGVEKSPVALDGTFSGAFKLLGDWAAPQLDGLLSMVGFKFRDTLFGDGHLRALPGGDATRIQGKFFGDKVQVDGYLTMVPKLTFVASIKFTDIALEKILPEMRKLAEVRGIASGEVRISLDAVQGLTFASLRMGKLELTLSATDEDGRPRHLVVRNQDDVLVQSDGQSLRVDRAKLTSPIGNFDMHGVVAQKDCDVQLKGEIGMELLEYFFRSAFDHTHGDARVDLSIKGNLDRPDLNGSITLLKAARLEPHGLEKFFTVPSGRVDFTPNSIALKNFQVAMDGAVAQASGFVELDHWVPGQIAADVSGELSPLFLQWLAKEQVAEASGRLAINMHVGGRWTRPEWSGAATVKGIHAQLRNFPQEIALTSGEIRFVNYDIVLSAIAGKLDDHPISAQGTVKLGEGPSLRGLDLALAGAEINYSVADLFAVTMSPRLTLSTLKNDPSRLKLSGRIEINEGRYSQNWGDLHDLVIRPRVVEKSTPFWQGSPRLETMELDIQAVSNNSLLFKNDILDLNAEASLNITGTLSEPRFNGNVRILEGGQVRIPGARCDFTSKSSELHFDPDRRLPDETPEFNLSAEGTLTDSNDAQHNLLLTVSGVLAHPLLRLTAPQENWEPQEAFIALFSGKTPNQIRQQMNNTSSSGSTSFGTPSSGSIGDNLTKTITGLGLGNVISDPIRKLFGFDQTTLEFSTGSVDLRVCKRINRNVKTCGYGEIGFAGASRGSGTLELRVSDWISGLLKAEYVSPNVNSLEDVNSRVKLELKFQFPLGY